MALRHKCPQIVASWHLTPPDSVVRETSAVKTADVVPKVVQLPLNSLQQRNFRTKLTAFWSAGTGRQRNPPLVPALVGHRLAASESRFPLCVSQPTDYYLFYKRRDSGWWRLLSPCVQTLGRPTCRSHFWSMGNLNKVVAIKRPNCLSGRTQGGWSVSQRHRPRITWPDAGHANEPAIFSARPHGPVQNQISSQQQ